MQHGLMPMLSKGASRAEIVRNFGSLTPEKIITNKYPSIAKIKRYYDTEKTEAMIGYLLIQTSEAFDNTLDEEQAIEIAADMGSTFPYFSLEDVFFVLQRMKRQRLYGKLTVNKVLAAFEEYDKERTKRAEEMNWNDHLSNKENPNADDRSLSLLKSPVSPGKKSNPKKKKK